MKKTTLLSGLFITLIIGLLIPSVFAGSVSDINGHEWENSIQILLDESIVEGYSDGTYKPDQTLNRAEFTKIVMETAYTEDDFQGWNEPCFNDVDVADWYLPYVCLAQEEGIIEGYPDGSFGGANTINQAEVIKILGETFYKDHVEELKNEHFYPEHLYNWYDPYFQLMIDLGIGFFGAFEWQEYSLGMDLSTAAPHLLTRGEMAYFVAKLIEPSNTDQIEMSLNGDSLIGDATLIVLSVPYVYDEYYLEQFEDIVEFQTNYAQLILDAGDRVIAIADEVTLPMVEDRFPDGVMLEAELWDIWMRDFTTVNPLDPVQFRYAAAAQGGDQDAADQVQDKFNELIAEIGITPRTSSYILDGGNVVDNYEGRAVVTDRFLEDNDLSYEEGVEALKSALNVDEVAIIENDDPEGLAHADGMLMFVDADTIVINDYQDEDYQSVVEGELESAFPGITIVRVPVEFDNEVWDPSFGSACNINLNALMTDQNIYMPTFDHANDSTVLETLRSLTTKNVVEVPASGVCYMGGSVRCLSWQVLGDRADLLLGRLNQ